MRRRSGDRALALKAHLALLAMTFIWGSTFPLVKGALADADPLTFNVPRFGIALAAIWLLWGKGTGDRAPSERWSREGWKAGGLIGLFMFLGYTFQTFGLLFTTPSKSAFITALSVILVPVASTCMARRLPSIGVAGGALLALGGTYLLYHPIGANFGLGDLLTGFCTISYAAQILAVERYARRYPIRQLVSAQIAVPFLLTALLLGVSATTPWRMHDSRFALTQPVVVALLVSGLGGTALAYAVQNWAQQFTSASHAAVIFALEPVFAAFFSRWLVGEILGPSGMLGGALIVAGAVWAVLATG